MNKKIKILYVEDEKEIVNNTVKPLQYLCDELYCAYDGFEGLQKFKERRPDIIISDIRMPKMDGIEMCKEIKKINPNQHIILLTAYSDSEYFMNAIEMQVDGYLLKPLDYDLLETKIENIIKSINLKEKYELQEKRLKEQELHNLAQMKNIQMGDIIGNIAHQWRQPLNTISAAAGLLKLKKDMGTLEDKEFSQKLDVIADTTQNLSKTIDTFKEYIREQNEKRVVSIQDRINIALDMIEASLKHKNIELISNINEAKPLYMTVIVGELTQIIMNIFNNSKDILKKKKDGWIRLSLEERNKEAIIVIEDNGGGIDDDIIHNIFDLYFTTKFKSHEKGLGLYLTKKIVEDSLKGSISVRNSDFGAVFRIELPLEAKHNPEIDKQTLPFFE